MCAFFVLQPMNTKKKFMLRCECKNTITKECLNIKTTINVVGDPYKALNDFVNAKNKEGYICNVTYFAEVS